MVEIPLPLLHHMPVDYFEYASGKEYMVEPADLKNTFYMLRQRRELATRNISTYVTQFAVELLVTVEDVNEKDDKWPDFSKVSFDFMDASADISIEGVSHLPYFLVEPSGLIVDNDSQENSPGRPREAGYFIPADPANPLFQLLVRV